jgi:rare lipoprotein A
MVCATMASCATTQEPPASPKKNTRSKEYFSETEYGVKASPRVVQEGQPVPKGGGRFMVGDPYQVRGKTYVPKEDSKYNKSGLASWYGSAFHGRYTANGEVYDSASLTAAHPTFPLPSYARVTNLDNGSSVIVRVNDRGPYHEGRILDVSSKTAEMLDMKRMGTAHVNVQYVGRARMDGQDAPFLMASYVRKGDRLPSFNPGGQIASGVMVASNQPLRDQMQSFGSSLPQPSLPGGRSPVASKGQGAVPIASAQAFPSSNRFVSTAPAAPRVSDRPLAEVARQPQRVVASAAPMPSQPRFAEPAPQPRPVSQPRVVAQQPRIAPESKTVQPVAQPRLPAGSAAGTAGGSAARCTAGRPDQRDRLCIAAQGPRPAGDVRQRSASGLTIECAMRACARMGPIIGIVVPQARCYA